MGKKQHSKDRAYLTTTEWRTEWGGYKAKIAAPFKRLPFHCCAITFTPFEDPVCTDDGNIYDIVHAVPYVMKYKRHPITGQPLQLKDLIKLNFHKNTDGEFACPVMGKVFTEHTHIVAIRATGNVYCWDAVEELNVKPKCWKDLLTDEPFTRKDIIHIQDPFNLQHRDIQTFDHVKKELLLEDAGDEAGKDGSSIRNASDDMKRALGALGTKESQDAYQRGGGGKRVEVMRLLTEAKAAATAGERASGASAEAAKLGGASGGASASAPGEGDWRLKGPVRDVVPTPHFKPGASTWDTDDPGAIAAASATAAKANKRKSTWGGPGPNGPAAPGPASKAGGESAAAAMTVQQRYEAAGHVKYKEGPSTTGAGSRSFTSSVSAVVTTNQRQLTRVERNPSKKGYVRLHTNLGDINLELHCDLAPRTCENFLALCTMDYYNGTLFHRSIKNFMIQGGDPTGSGTGGESIYGPRFKDELDSRLVHNGRGVLSMANSGPNSNGSQFFISYKSCRHLDYKHSVFGKVVGGFEILSAMEKVAVDKDDRPTSEIKITGVSIFTNPYTEMEEEEKRVDAEKATAAAKGADAEGDDSKVGQWFSNPSQEHSKETRTGVGKYLSLTALPAPAEAVAPASEPAPASEMAPPPAKKPKAAAKFGNFDAW